MIDVMPVAAVRACDSWCLKILHPSQLEKRRIGPLCRPDRYVTRFGDMGNTSEIPDRRNDIGHPKWRVLPSKRRHSPSPASKLSDKTYLLARRRDGRQIINGLTDAHSALPLSGF